MSGRPAKLHPEIKASIIASISIGATYRDAAEAAGVAYQTFLNWMAKGEAATSGNFREFFDSVRKAEAQARVKFTSVIAKSAADGDWKAAVEFLKRRDKANWGDNVDMTSAGQAITFIIKEDKGDAKDD